MQNWESGGYLFLQINLSISDVMVSVSICQYSQLMESVVQTWICYPLITMVTCMRLYSRCLSSDHHLVFLKTNICHSRDYSQIQIVLFRYNHISSFSFPVFFTIWFQIDNISLSKETMVVVRWGGEALSYFCKSWEGLFSDTWSIWYR